MKWIIKIFAAFLLMLFFAMLLDIIGWVYDIAWIFPIIIAAVIIIRFIVRPDFREKVYSLVVGRKREEIKSPSSYSAPKRSASVDVLKELIDLAAVDGEISESEKRTIIRKGVEMGMDPNDVEIFVNARICELKLKK